MQLVALLASLSATSPRFPLSRVVIESLRRIGKVDVIVNPLNSAANILRETDSAPHKVKKPVPEVYLDRPLTDDIR